jgi:hypothetical protein
MALLQEELAHPSQPSRVRLSVFPDDGEGFLVTEERIGTVTVFNTLGLFADREAAESRLRERHAELVARRYGPTRTVA